MIEKEVALERLEERDAMKQRRSRRFRAGRARFAMLLAAIVACAGCASARDKAEPAPEAAAGAISSLPRADPASPPPVTFGTWTFGAWPGRVVTTPHYRIRTTIGSEVVLDRLARFMEGALAHYTTALAELPLPREPMTTYVFHNRDLWTAQTRLMLPDQADSFENLGRGGYTTGGVSVLYDIDGGRGNHRDTFAIAAHEGWHQFTQSSFRDHLPVWLEEGIATYVEGYDFPSEAEMPEFFPSPNRERRRALRDALQQDTFIPLPLLLQERPQSFLEEGKDRLLTYYAQVWALARFLAEDGHGRYRQPLAELLVDASEGRLWEKVRRSPAVLSRLPARQAASRLGPALILAYFNRDLAEFERDYTAFAERIAD